jgi:hypothetical protein
VVEQLRSWFHNNHTLVVFLGAQLVTLGAGAAWMIAYSVKLETRVATMEVRGASYTVDRLNNIDQKLTAMEGSLKEHEARINRMLNEFLKDRRP